MLFGCYESSWLDVLFTFDVELLSVCLVIRMVYYEGFVVCCGIVGFVTCLACSDLVVVVCLFGCW